MKNSGCAKDFFSALVVFLILFAIGASMIQEYFPALWEALPFLFGFFFWVGVQIVLMRLFSKDKNWATAGGCLALLVENVVFMILFSVFSTGWASVLAQTRNGPVTKSDWTAAGYNLPQYVSAPPTVTSVFGPKGIRKRGIEEVLQQSGVSGIDIRYALNLDAFRNNGGTVNLYETDKAETIMVIYADTLSPPGWTANQKAQYLTYWGGCRRVEKDKSRPKTESECQAEARKFSKSEEAKAEKFKILP